MTTASASGPPKDWNLRHLSKWTLLQSMVREVLTKNNADAAATPTTGGPVRDRRKHPYIVLVVDAATQMTINAACEMHDLLQEGICLMEMINGSRHPLPMLDSIYFLSPTQENVERLVQDAQNSSPENNRTGAMYRTFHVFFAHKLPDDLLESVAKSPVAAKRMSTFCELNLSFSAFDARGFHLGENSKLRKTISREALKPAELEDTANKLSTLLSSLGECRTIWYNSGKKNEGSACDKLAHAVRKRLIEVESKGKRASEVKPLDCTLVIYDRSYDFTTLLSYDLRYESLIYDALATEVSGMEENKYTFKDSEEDSNKTVVLTPEKDRYFAEFRHLPLWQVNAVVVDGIRTWTAQDAQMRDKTGGGKASTTGQMVSSTLSALQALPEHKNTYKLLHSHSEICQTCVKFVEGDELVDLTTLMQDCACDVDSDTNKLVSSYVESSLKTLMENGAVSAESKARLMLLLASSAQGQGNESMIDSMANLLDAPDGEILKHDLWRRAQSKLKEELVTKRRKRVKEKLRDGTITPRTKNLCRWEPLVVDVLELALTNELEKHDFKSISSGGGATHQQTGDGRKQAVIVFIVGGVGLSEIRAAHEVSRKLGIEAFVGGSCLLTPRLLLETFRRVINPSSFEDEEGGEALLDR